MSSLEENKVKQLIAFIIFMAINLMLDGRLGALAKLLLALISISGQLLEDELNLTLAQDGAIIAVASFSVRVDRHLLTFGGNGGILDLALPFELLADGI